MSFLFGVIAWVWAEAPLNVEIKSAELVAIPKNIAEIFVADPTIADVHLSGAEGAYILGKNQGKTSFMMLSKEGKVVSKKDIVVTHSLSHLKSLLKPLDPLGQIKIHSIPSGIVMEGSVETPKAAEDVRELVQQFLGEKQVLINRLTVSMPTQVMLKVKIAEVRRDVINRFGINWNTATLNQRHFSFGVLSGPRDVALDVATNLGLRPTGTSINTDSVLGRFSDNITNINTTIDALSQEGLATVLAEPNLIALSGQTATFLAGGEFPFPIPQSQGNVTIEFKKFGISLSFTPTVLSNRTINLKVKPEVSELDQSQGITLSGVVVPGITTRQAETTVELGSGQSLAIAGLLKNDVESSIRALPGLGDLPIIGSLFRSNSFQRNESELVITITPFLVKPISRNAMALPTDEMKVASFAEQIFERKLTRANPIYRDQSLVGQGGLRLVGPVGFMME